MNVDMDGVQLELPPGFLPEETSASFRVAGDAGMKDPRALQPQALIRPNLVVQRKKVPAGTRLIEIAGGMCAELVRHVPGISEIDRDEGFTFADGSQGVLLKYTMPGFKEIRLLQLQAVRLDDDVSTSMLITAGAADISEDALNAYLGCLRSLSLKGNP